MSNADEVADMIKSMNSLDMTIHELQEKVKDVQKELNNVTTRRSNLKIALVKALNESGIGLDDREKWEDA